MHLVAVIGERPCPLSLLLHSRGYLAYAQLLSLADLSHKCVYSLFLAKNDKIVHTPGNHDNRVPSM